MSKTPPRNAYRPKCSAKKVLFRVLAMVVGWIFGILLVEVGLRVSNVWIGRHTDTMFRLMEYDEIFGWRMKRNLEAKVDLVDVEDIAVHSNSLGFWDEEFQIDRDSSRPRIVFLGDSFTWGFGVHKEERFTSLMAASRPDWEVLNFGIPGYGVDQSLLVWRHLAKKYQPDLVVIVVYENDLGDNVHVVRSGLSKPFFELANNEIQVRNLPVSRDSFWENGIFNQIAPPYSKYSRDPVRYRSRTLHWLAKNSQLARFGYTLFRRNVSQSPVPETVQHHSLGVDPNDLRLIDSLPEMQQVQVRLLCALLQQLNSDVSESNAGLLVVFAGNPNSLLGLVHAYHRLHGIESVDVTTNVLTDLIPSDEPVYYAFNKHWTPSANLAVSNLLVEYIADRRLLFSEKATSRKRARADADSESTYAGD